MADLIGRKIDNYRIDALLGEGGMGAVFRAYDLNLARSVALKVMHRQFAQQPEFQRRFLQEAQAAARLGDHPAIVNIHDFGSRQGLFYMVMEFIPGNSLGKYIKHVRDRGQVVKLSETLFILAQVAEALSYAHRKGVIHRDIKPDNILLKPLEKPDRAGEPSIRAVVTDFGLAKLLEGGVQTQTGTFMGTLPYMSPEQCMGKELDGRSDLYSLGIILYQLATGRLPFDIRSPTEAVFKHMNETPPPPQEVRPGVPDVVAQIIEMSIAKSPADRYQKGTAMAEAMRQAAGSLTDDDVTRFAPPTSVVSLVTQLLPAEMVNEPSRPGFELTAMPGEARLLVSRKGKEPRSFRLIKETITIGRGEENDITLTAQGVSRVHARVRRSRDGTFSVTDTGSTNGTYMGKSKLLPDLPENWEPGQSVRIGPFFLRLEQTQPVTMAGRGTLPLTDAEQIPVGGTRVQGTSGQLSVTIQPTNVTIPSGGQADLQVNLLNQGPLVDHFKIAVKDLPPGWVRIPQDTVNLMPEARTTLPLTIRPPMDSSARAGQHAYSLVVSSESDRREVAVINGQVNIQPFERFSIDMRPKRLSSGGVCRVLVRNEGNAPARFNIFGRDPAEAIDFDKPKGRLKVPAGERGTADLHLTAKKRPLLGASQSLPFNIFVGSDSGKRQQMGGQLNVKPLLPRWLLPLLGLLAVLLCVSGVIVANFIRDRDESAVRTAQAQVAADEAQARTREFIEASDAEAATRAVEYSAATATSDAATAIAEGDDDGDGLSNSKEAELGTLPDNPDTDGDGLDDGDEQFEGTDPLKRDTDNDLLSDGDEVNVYGTSPIDDDTDDDGVTDGAEVNEGGDPLKKPTETPTPSPTSTPTPSVTPSPTPTPTPAQVVAQLEPDLDRHWPSTSAIFLLCLNPPCATSTPIPSFGHSAELSLQSCGSTGPGIIISCFSGKGAVYFDLSQIPSSATVNQATLQLRLTSGINDGLEIGVGLVTESWNEDSSGVPDCNFVDQVLAPVGQVPGLYNWDLTDFIRDLVANPGSNWGFCLRGDISGTRTFISREGPVGQRPQLEVVYRP